MKTPFILLSFLFILLVSFPALAQNDTSDKIVMLNGEEKIGKVTEVGDDFIKFVHQGETLAYTFKKKDINKIQFASGRVEFLTESVKNEKQHYLGARTP